MKLLRFVVRMRNAKRKLRIESPVFKQGDEESKTVAELWISERKLANIRAGFSTVSVRVVEQPSPTCQ